MSIREREVIESGPTLPAGDPKGGGEITNSEVLPKEQGVQSQLQAPQPWRMAPGRQIPLPGSENRQGLPSGEPEGCQRLHSERTHEISSSLSPASADVAAGKMPESEPCADLGKFLREAGGGQNSPGKCSRLAAVVFEILFFHHWHQCWEAPFQNPLSSLLVPGACLTLQQACSRHEGLSHTASHMGEMLHLPTGVQLS